MLDAAKRIKSYVSILKKKKKNYQKWLITLLLSKEVNCWPNISFLLPTFFSIQSLTAEWKNNSNG